MSNPINNALAGSLEQKRAVCCSIRENAVFNAPYLTMNALSTIVASYGLLENSAAVVIGAMIIAMLLGPISGIALALVSGDSGLLRKAAAAEVGGAAVVLSIAFCIGKIHQGMPLTDQIISRTSPNILDLMIALAGGAAGAYATISPRLSVGLVGVAIATALVPPLAVCSICMANGEPQMAFGGFLLFFANFVAIQVSYSLVMLLHGYHKIGANDENQSRALRRNALSIAALLGLAVILGYDFTESAAKEHFEATVRATLKKELRPYHGVYLADVRFSTTSNKETVIAVLRTPYSFGPSTVGKLEADLKKEDGMTVELHVRSVITKEATSTGFVYNVPQTETPVELSGGD